MRIYFAIMLLLPSSWSSAEQSICYGTTSDGRLERGVKLPGKGPNYTSYSKTAELMGRTYVHSKVRDIILAAYKSLDEEMPDKVFKYAETGFREGGKFKPHRTHRNGLSADFMVPVINKEGKSVHLPTHYFNKLGYAIELDQTGKYKEYTIDNEALAAHISSQHKSALTLGSDIERIVFDPELQSYLMKTKYGEYLKTHIQFNETRSWVRHDEHYHVDFVIPCKGN